MASLYQYAIIRYRPYAETAEFANIGVVAFDISLGSIDYQLAPKRFTRIKGFFDQEAYEAYAACIDAMRIELPRLSDYLVNMRNHNSELVFHELVRPRESSVTYSEVRAAKFNASLEDVVQKLYMRYVKRDFTQIESAEQTLTKDIRRTLKMHGIGYFKQARIDDDLVPMTFPLATKENGFHAIKPLSFAHKSPLHVLDYAAHWRQRFGYLLGRNKLNPGSVLLAVEGPTKDTDDRIFEAYDVARAELASLPFQLALTDDDLEAQLLRFANHVTLRQSSWH